MSNKKSTTTSRLIILIFLIFNSFLGNAQKVLPQNLLKDLNNRIINLKKNNQYFNAEILQVFLEKGGGDLQIQKEIENISNNPENQRLLFSHWYNKYDVSLVADEKVIDRYAQLYNYFINTFQFSKPSAADLARYINNQEFNGRGNKKIDQTNNSIIKKSVDEEVKVNQLIDRDYDYNDEEMGFENYKVYSCIKNGVRGTMVNAIKIHDDYYVGIVENKKLTKYGIASSKVGTYKIVNKNEIVYDSTRINFAIVNRKNKIVGNIKVYPNRKTKEGIETWYITIDTDKYILETKEIQENFNF